MVRAVRCVFVAVTCMELNLVGSSAAEAGSIGTEFSNLYMAPLLTSSGNVLCLAVADGSDWKEWSAYLEVVSG